MDADSLLKSGDLDGARKVVAEQLRAAPDDVKARQFFWQLASVYGEWEKAAAQLRSLAAVESSMMMLATVYGQAISAEGKRADVLSGDQNPASLIGVEPWVEGVLDAQAAVFGARPGAADQLAEKLADAPAVSGEIDGERFDWFADADPRFGPMLEVIVGDQYGMAPFAALKSIRFAEPTALRDLVWASVELETLSGQTAAAFVPVTYPGSAAMGDADAMLGRKTDWRDVDGLPHGLGQRMFATEADEKPLLDVREIKFGV